MEKASRTILIVDDEYDILNSLEMVFTAEGFSVRTAHDGKEALEQLAKVPLPDLILSDIMMPIMDGYALVKAVKEVPSFRKIPIILISAALLDDSKCKKKDYTHFIRKPFDLDRLILVVRQSFLNEKIP